LKDPFDPVYEAGPIEIVPMGDPTMAWPPQAGMQGGEHTARRVASRSRGLGGTPSTQEGGRYRYPDLVRRSSTDTFGIDLAEDGILPAAYGVEAKARQAEIELGAGTSGGSGRVQEARLARVSLSEESPFRPYEAFCTTLSTPAQQAQAHHAPRNIIHGQLPSPKRRTPRMVCGYSPTCPKVPYERPVPLPPPRSLAPPPARRAVAAAAVAPSGAYAFQRAMLSSQGSQWSNQSTGSQFSVSSRLVTSSSDDYHIWTLDPRFYSLTRLVRSPDSMPPSDTMPGQPEESPTSGKEGAYAGGMFLLDRRRRSTRDVESRPGSPRVGTTRPSTHVVLPWRQASASACSLQYTPHHYAGGVCYGGYWVSSSRMLSSNCVFHVCLCT